MRIQIKTHKPIKDPDIRALFILNAGVKQSTPRMVEANLRFVADKYGYEIKKKVAT